MTSVFGERLDRLRAAHFEHRFRAAFPCRHERRGMDLSFLRGRRHIDMLHPRRLGGKNPHADGGKQRRRAARHVNARAFHGSKEIPRRPALFVGADVPFRRSPHMIVQNALFGAADGFQKRGVYRFISLFEFFFADADGFRGQNRLIELFLAGKQRPVAVSFYVLDDGMYRRRDPLVLETAALYQFAAIFARIYFHRIPLSLLFGAAREKCVSPHLRLHSTAARIF